MVGHTPIPHSARTCGHCVPRALRHSRPGPPIVQRLLGALLFAVFLLNACSQRPRKSREHGGTHEGCSRLQCTHLQKQATNLGDGQVSGPGSEKVSGPGDERVSGPGDERVSGPGRERVSGPGDERVSGPKEWAPLPELPALDPARSSARVACCQSLLPPTVSPAVVGKRVGGYSPPPLTPVLHRQPHSCTSHIPPPLTPVLHRHKELFGLDVWMLLSHAVQQRLQSTHTHPTMARGTEA